MSPKVISGQERAALKDIPECYIREEADDTEVRLEMIVVAEEIAPYKLETQSGCVAIRIIAQRRKKAPVSSIRF